MGRALTSSGNLVAPSEIPQIRFEYFMQHKSVLQKLLQLISLGCPLRPIKYTFAKLRVCVSMCVYVCMYLRAYVIVCVCVHSSAFFIAAL